MKKLYFFGLLCFFISLATVAATPIVGHQFYGYAGSGSTVTAEVNGQTFNTAVQSNNYYGYGTLFFIDAQSDDIDGAKEGDIITFYLDSVKVVTYIFEIGGVTKLDFADDSELQTSDEKDSDGDGVPDNDDVCSGYDDNTDSDNDGTPDGCDSTPTGTTDTTTDDSDDDDDDYDSYSSSGSSSRKSTTTTTSSGCYHKWQCTSWGACQENGFQTRICYYVGNCTTEGNQSDTRQHCVYVAPEEPEVITEIEETCYDEIRNQGELGIDCGGPCEACEIPPIEKKPQTNWFYIGLGILIILVIIAVILAYKYKSKWLPYWEKLKSKFVKTAPVKTAVMPQYKPQSPQQQYYQYRK